MNSEPYTCFVCGETYDIKPMYGLCAVCGEQAVIDTDSPLTNNWDGYDD